MRDFELEVYFARHEFSARHHLTASDAETLTVEELLALGSEGQRRGFGELRLGYVPTWGTDELRAAIAATYEHVEAEHVLCFAGAEEALFWAMREVVGPGDHAIVTLPAYQSMETVPLATGAQVSGLVLDPEAGWALDLGEVERLLRPETRLIAVNFPNNPTGAVPDPAVFAALIDLCDEHGIRLFSDEVYRGLELDPARTLPQAADCSAAAISMNVMSKAYGLPGLRIGWLACRDRALLERLERRKHYTTICNSGPSEALATIALEHGEQLRARNRAIVATNLPRFDRFFEDWGELFEWEHPQGGCVCYPRCRDGDVEQLCRELVEQAGVLLLPASVYRSELAELPGDRFRIGVGRRDPEPGLAAFDAYLRERV